MPRQARIVVPGYLYHITQRGNHKQNVFEEDRDRAVYLRWVQENSVKWGVDIYAYCLMDNHVHFIARPQRKESFARTFKVAHMRYAYYFNCKRGVKGHLWQGRFFSCILHGSHLKAAVKYVVCNPVRARMVERPWDYKWSSARAHLGKQYKIIKLADIKKFMDVGSWKTYLSEIESQEELKQIRECTLKGFMLGPIDFIKKLEKKLNRKLLLSPRGRPKRQ